MEYCLGSASDLLEGKWMFGKPIDLGAMGVGIKPVLTDPIPKSVLKLILRFLTQSSMCQ